MSLPTIAIGMPVFNGERFLRRAVESVLFQTYPDWELLISDNGSSDRTISIAREYEMLDPRIRARVNKTNLGAVANFEVVFRESDGEFFMWLAHDDWIAPTYLETCVQVLGGNPNAVLAFAGMNVVDDTGSAFRSRTERIDDAASPNPVVRFHSVLWRLKDPTSPVFGVMRRSALGQTGLLRNSNEPDRILISELSLLGELHQIREVLFWHYGPPGHTRRDNWAWLNPRNRGRPRLATLRIVYHQWRAIWRSRHTLGEKFVMSADLLVASVIKRTAGKGRAISKGLGRQRSAGIQP